MGVIWTDLQHCQTRAPQPDGEYLEQHLSACAFAYNNAKQSSTELAYVEVLLGRRLECLWTVPYCQAHLQSTTTLLHLPPRQTPLGRLQDSLAHAQGTLWKAKALRKPTGEGLTSSKGTKSS